MVFPFHAQRMPVSGNRGVVSSAHHLSTKAGIEMFAKGGNAFDAAAAVSLALSVVEPHHSGIGGGCFSLIHDAKTKKLHAFDARGVAPAEARKDMFVKNGEPLLDDMLFGHRAVAVPALVENVFGMLERFGALDFATVAEPAIRYAEEGFIVYPFLETVFSEAETNAKLRLFPETRATYLKKNGEIYKTGELFRQEAQGNTLRKISKSGKDVFYKGELAQAIAQEMSSGKGILSLKDLEACRVKPMTPLYGTYRNYEVYGMPPPSSGGGHVIQMLNLLEGHDIRGMGRYSAKFIHLLTEYMKIAFADRSEVMDDPAFWNVPVEALISKEYADKRRKEVEPRRAKNYQAAPELKAARHKGGTTHFSVADGEGNVVSITQTVRDWFGSGVVVPGTGILLNNIMADFSPMAGVATSQGLVYGESNAVEGGKTPLSSMSPTIVLKNGSPYMATGAAGGPRIITATLQSIVNVLDFGMNVRDAVWAARTHSMGVGLEIERGALLPEVVNDLKERGHEIVEVPANDYFTCWVHAVTLGERLYGGAESRIGGMAMGCSEENGTRSYSGEGCIDFEI
ncbi:MAG: gamma-glutamyltransferase [Synergistaceae bacterium]|jgi:gamma-glutamyltranspeptidase/glutathione hydrolase|nr:gamma-glutamyltransferase [Synergistaceae bacterium]